MRKNWLFLILATTFIIAQYNSNAQKAISGRNSINDPTRVISDEKELGLALGLFVGGSYFDAIDYYQDLRSRDERNPYLAYILGECYMATRDYVPAAHHYAETYYLDKKDYPLSAFFAGQMFKQQGEYKQAITWFKQFLTDNKKTAANNPLDNNFNRTPTQKEYKNYKKLAQIEIDGCEMAMISIKDPAPVNIFNCGPNVNSAYTELSPYPLGDSMLLFSTLNRNTLEVTTFNRKSNKPDMISAEHFMIAKKQPGYVDSFQWPLPFNDGGFNAQGLANGANVGNGCYSPGGDRFYFTQCKVKDSFRFVCKIYYSQFLEHKWSPAMLVPSVNEADGEESNSMPFVAKVGKKEILYFASNRKLQSRGGYDIWYSVIDPRNGTFRRPQNCGKAINTKSDELTPYYDTRVGKLYFASNGRKSFGGFDINVADGGPSRYSKVQNLGYPFNTSADEFYFIKDPVGKPDAYIVSNRIGTIALKNPTCCNDIWRIQYEPRLVIIGKVLSKKDQSIMPQSVVKMLDQKSEMTTYSSEDGNFIFNMTRNHSYVLTADKPGYTSSRATVSTMSVKRSDADDTVHVTIYLDSIKHSFSVSNIYYDYDQATLRAESVASLDTLVNFMKDNPSIQVEIYSYTDGKGTDEYNFPLSQRRAQSVLDYLEKNGVERQRMTAKGFGKKNQVAVEVTPDGKTDIPEARQLNRRTEFRIIGDLPTRRVIFNSAMPGSMDQQERNLRQEADDEPDPAGAKAPKEEGDN
ncbi:OmpA family protein [Flavipsychrobacter stenotrophus]|nr:OmpA family protein [Flavipsychrobacter stenotrophus]